jgi:thioredoxin 1
MSKIDKRKLVDVEEGLDEELKRKDRVFVLFYASWCPFSARFLPIFDKYSQEKTRRCLRVKIDDKASLMEKYSVEVVPTVLLFENGTVAKRLDGVAGAGLSEEQLKALIDARKH